MLPFGDDGDFVAVQCVCDGMCHDDGSVPALGNAGRGQWSFFTIFTLFTVVIAVTPSFKDAVFTISPALSAPGWGTKAVSVPQHPLLSFPSVPRLTQPCLEPEQCSATELPSQQNHNSFNLISLQEWQKSVQTQVPAF